MPAPRVRSPSSSSISTVFLRFSTGCANAGITIPIVPGIMPVHNFKQVEKIAEQSGTSVPDWLGNRFEGWTRTRRRAASWPRRSPPSRSWAWSTGHHRVPLLHAEPRRPGLRDLPSLGLASRSDGVSKAEAAA